MQESENSQFVSNNLSFESLKKLNEHGIEYWSARDLQPCLGYSQWRRFENATQKAIESCKQSGNDPSHHFADAGKQINLGKGATQTIEDYHLSRFACYLIAQNGDSRKPEIAFAQKYFAIQTRRQEISEQMAADLERLETRQQASVEFKALSGAAREAGVQDKMFGVFHDAGYKGLYGGLGSDAIKARKGILPKENLMDRMDTTELIANQFRMSQTREKLKRENIRNQRDAMETHETVGKKVRSAIEEIGGTLPENILPAEPIKKVEKRLKVSKPLLTLDPKDAVGLISPEQVKKEE
ncbi:MAG: DNA-damage-inducible protein [Parachlamydiales bacterium]|nr:DNA-damage-inducible protein [Parachlamydiales bacterium]